MLGKDGLLSLMKSGSTYIDVRIADTRSWIPDV